MARTVRDANLMTPSARLALPVRGKPFWRFLEEGLHLGYRRRARGGGPWIARRYIGGERYQEEQIGTADDYTDADGEIVLTFTQAQQKARAWWIEKERIARGLGTGPYTVADALRDYFEDRVARGGKDVEGDRGRADLRILPQLRSVALSDLTTKRLTDWRNALARRGEDDDEEDARKKRSTANRTLAILKAALNHAFRTGQVSTDIAWRRVTPLKEASAPVVRFLTADELARLLNACQGQFRNLVAGAVHTGARYGELIRMKVADYNPDAKSVTVRISKSGKPRHIALTNEGARLFETLAAGKTAGDLLFVKDDGQPWKKSNQQDPMSAACARAKIEPEISFHILRHCHASLLVMSGASISVVQAQLGHSTPALTSRHYAHLSPDHIGLAVRENFPDLGGAPETNVTPLSSKRTKR
jgi:integrase